MIPKHILDIVVCPKTKQKLKPADYALIERINLLIEKGEAKNKSGSTLIQKIEGGLVREDGKYLYPVIEGIPILLPEEAIPLEGIE